MTQTSKQDRLDAITTATNRAGGIMKFAEAMGVTHQAVYGWRRRGVVPPDKAMTIETLYGVPRERLVSPALLALIATPQAAADLI